MEISQPNLLIELLEREKSEEGILHFPSVCKFNSWTEPGNALPMP